MLPNQALLLPSKNHELIQLLRRVALDRCFNINITPFLASVVDLDLDSLRGVTPDIRRGVLRAIDETLKAASDEIDHMRGLVAELNRLRGRQSLLVSLLSYAAAQISQGQPVPMAELTSSVHELEQISSRMRVVSEEIAASEICKIISARDNLHHDLDQIGSDLVSAMRNMSLIKLIC